MPPHSSFYACPLYLQVWQISDKRWVRKAGDIISFTTQGHITPKVTGQIQLKFDPVQDFMSVLVTCNFDEDWIHSNWEKVETSFSPLPEVHWSCITHLSAEDMLKSAVIEEKKFKHSPRVGADNPLGPNILCQQEGLITMVFCCKFKKNLFNLWHYTHLFMI